MDEALKTSQCEACRRDAPQATPEEISRWIEEIPAWTIIERDGIAQLERRYDFRDFVSALAFTDAVGQLAEAQGHHPSLLTEWGRVTVTWWSHKIKGLHRNDFVMAAKTDAIYEASTA